MLEKESQLFGAMDGAIKFVKNDAIAGLIITAINLIGGIAIGMLQKDMTLSQAGSIYSVLTVGDGLIGIIPSLLTSVAAGLIVTRVTKGEADGSSTAQDMILDLTSNARALQISGLFCACFALVPGMPAVVFLVASALLLGKSFFVDKGNKKNDIEPQAQHIDDALNAAAIGKDMEDITLTKTFLPMEVKIPGSLEPNLKQMFRSICKASRNQLIEESGALYPTIDFSEHAAPQIEFHVFGVPMLEIDPSDRRIAVFCEPSRLESLGIDVVRERDPILGRDFYLTEPVNKNSLDKNNISYCCFEKRWSNLIIGLFVSRSVDYFNLNDFQRHVARLSDKNGEQLKELERVLPLSKVTEVFQKLLIERVSVKNIRTVLNCLIDWAQRERDVLVIAEQVRKGLFEQISFQHCVDKTFSICTLSPDFEQSIRESIRSDGSRTFIDADASSLNLMVDMIEVQYSEFYHFEKLPLLITSMDCRAHVRMLIQDRLSAVPVLSYQEISNRYGIKLLKSIEYDDSLISINHDTREA
jgi:type III secretion protein V